MRFRTGIAMVLALGACAPTSLIRSTSTYADVTAAAAVDIEATPSIVTRVCRLRAELEYLVQRVHLGDDVPSFEAFYTTAAFSLQLPGAATITWKQQCLAYHVADDAFAKALGSISAYSAALGTFADSGFTSSKDLKSIAKSAADSAAVLSATAQPYKSALEGIGKPLAKIADAASTRWQAHELRALVDQTDQPLHDAIAKLDAFIGVLHTEQLRDVREALDMFRQEMKFRDKLDLVSAAIVDVDMTERLSEIDHQLAAISDLLHLVANAHGELMRSWDAEDGGAATQAMATFGHEVAEVAREFATSSRGD